ncbi:MAG: hypothetical protein IJI01_01805 [Butyrivibrio sp.]|uniref:hypothetical protein n=1 Tax=Butyrivibrio sp. TaxID=28121 RepID=UPI0025B80422|nr:hypothetical protein [Butyrivibrio sp.]MBQ6587396.1 hypothetical protein [Butyrivibrio sp.]
MDEKIMSIDENELENVTGGNARGRGSTASNTEEKTAQAKCPFCNKTTTFIVYSGTRGKCKECGNMSQI